MLAYCFKKLIESYWKIVPESKRKICLYKLTCSKAVYQKIETDGFFAGVKFYLYRRKNCKDGFEFCIRNKKTCILTKAGEIIEENNINPLLIKEYKINI